MYNNYNNGMYSYNTRADNRFWGGGFVFPFVLGGLVGNLWNNNKNVYYYPYQVPYYYPYPTYNSSNYYY